MTRSSEDAARALQGFDPLLVQLASSDAPLKVILSEGFSPFELRAVRTLLKRTGTTHDNGPAGEGTSRLSVTADRVPLLAD